MGRIPRSPLVAIALLALQGTCWAPAAMGLTKLNQISYDAKTRRIVIKANGPLAPLSYLAKSMNCWVIELRHTDYSHLRFHLANLPQDPIQGFMFNFTKPRTAQVIFYLNRPVPFPYKDRAITRDSYCVGIGHVLEASASLKPRVQMALRPTHRAPLPYPEWALVGSDSSAWDWRTSSQIVYASDVFQFNDGPAQTGARLSYQGLFQKYVPQVHGVVLGDVEQQTMRFVEPRFNYGNFVSSVALNHTLSPWIQLFEGGALLYSKADYTPESDFLDSNLFTGAGIFGAAPGGGTWYGSLTIDRVSSSTLRDSYYGQALRFGYQRPLFWNLSLHSQATLQRIDPMIVSTPFYRGYLFGTLETVSRRGWSYGLSALGGTQQVSGSNSWYGEIGPFLQIRF